MLTFPISYVPIGCAELRFAPVPRRGIISIEKRVSPLSVLRRGIIENDDAVKSLRDRLMEKAGKIFSIDIIPLRGIN
jgi:hypothetical protein